MLTYTTYSEAGGVAKTTTAANLAKAHERAGLDVLVIPLDSQKANFSFMMGVDDDRDDEDADNLVRHLVGQPKGDLEDLIVEVEGIDVIPEHNMLSDLGDHLRTAKEYHENMGESFGMYTRLVSVLKKAEIPSQYDVIIADPPASVGPHLYNAIRATNSLLIPVEPSPKGDASVEGLEDVVGGIEETLGVEVGVLSVVPTGFSDRPQEADILDGLDYPSPEVIRERESMMEGAWAEKCTAFTFAREHRERKREHELETLEKIDRLARYLEEQAGLDAPHPPEPGDLEPEVRA